MLSADELNDFHERLLDLETRVRGDYEHLTDEALDLQIDSRSPTHMAELGSDAYEQELTLRVAESDERILDAIRSALQRMEEGTYGICQGCVGKGKSPTKAVIPKAPTARDSLRQQLRRM